MKREKKTRHDLSTPRKTLEAMDSHSSSVAPCLLLEQKPSHLWIIRIYSTPLGALYIRIIVG